MGGGLGIDYHHPNDHPIPDFANYFKTFHEFLELRPSQQVHFELGRSLVGQCGKLISKVLYIKQGAAKDFAIIDASMTDLLRPALYHSYHHIEALETEGKPMQKYDVVGPVCESSDIFRKQVEISSIQRGDLLAIHSVGAYGQVMGSEYNMRARTEAVYYHG